MHGRKKRSRQARQPAGQDNSKGRDQLNPLDDRTPNILKQAISAAEGLHKQIPGLDQRAIEAVKFTILDELDRIFIAQEQEAFDTLRYDAPVAPICWRAA